MIRTVNRQPMSVPIKGNKDKFFNQVEFKGLCDKQNDVTVDAQTFSDVENMFVDDNNILTSRPPLKFYDGEAHIVDQWFFGSYGLRLYRIQTQMKYVNTNEIIKNELDTPIEYFSFILRCISHETVQGPEKFDILQWFIPVNEVGYNFLPKVNLTQLEDKIYIWFAGADFVCFNTSGLYFEDAVKYLYLPVHKQVINGIESELETKNFLTDTYRKRHLYNAFSDINFERLIDREMKVYLNSNETKNKSKHLYDITVQKNQDKMLIYPYSPVGSNYVDVVQTPRATVTMRYSATIHIIEVSFDGKFFRPLPILENIIGNPQLTKDGMWVVAFTRNGLAKCRLVAQETQDFIDMSRVFSWIIEHYMPKAITNGFKTYITELSTNFVPVGYFETIDQYAYVIEGHFKANPLYSPVFYLYVQWLSSTGKVMFSHTPLESVIAGERREWFGRDAESRDLKLNFKYVTPTLEHPMAASIVNILARRMYRFNDSTFQYEAKDNILLSLFLEVDEVTLEKNNTYIQSGDNITFGSLEEAHTIEQGLPLLQGYIKKLDTDAKIMIPGTIFHGDSVFFSDEPSFVPLENYILDNDIRYRIERLDGKSGPILPSDLVRFSSYDENVHYTSAELDGLLGFMYPDPPTSWPDTTVSPGTLVSIDGYVIIGGIGDSARVTYSDWKSLMPSSNLLLDSKEYAAQRFGLPCGKMDINTTPKLSVGNIIYNIKTCYSLYAENDGEGQLFDMVLDIDYNYTDKTYTQEVPANIGTSSQYLRISSGSMTVLTDKYLWIDGKKILLPTTGGLAPLIDDNERFVSNNDNLIITAQENDESPAFTYDCNIHKLSADGELVSGVIQSGDLVSYVANADSENDFLVSSLDRFTLNKIGDTGSIKTGDLICLSGTINYPQSPAGWEGQSWPTTGNWKYLKPVYILAGEIHFWKPGEPLPTGAVQIAGYASIQKRIKPLIVSETGTTYLIDGVLWTSESSSSASLELDEFINAKYEVDNSLLVNVHNEVPDHTAQLNETYMSFKTIKNNKNLLQVTSTRRDENKLFTEEGHDLLLYLPKINEQQFSKKITNLHTLSENEMGIFTEDEIWYIKAIINDAMVDYTAPIKSKLPVGCRDGSEIITALDGKVIIFTTQRGVTALSPQDFIASTEQTINYLSDNIQTNYQKFYNDEVFSSMLMPDEFIKSYSPLIKIRTYKYWVLFYRYMDRTILMLDTRNGSWWKWSTPYPIRSITVGTKLHILMQLDYSLIKDKALYSPVPPKKTLLGVSYILSDSEEVGYYDDTVENVLNGQGEWIHENDEVGGRRIVQYADPVIRWRFVSQRLHFNEINSYKTVKAINMSAKGTSIQTARLSNKVYRDFYHPEQSRVSEIKINDLRTFVQSLNLMHVVNFQYKIETDELNEEQSQIRINSLSIKYGVKENIR